MNRFVGVVATGTVMAGSWLCLGGSAWASSAATVHGASTSSASQVVCTPGEPQSTPLTGAGTGAATGTGTASLTSASTSQGGSQLAFTGTNVVALGGVGVALIGGGVLVTRSSRRRSVAPVDE